MRDPKKAQLATEAIAGLEDNLADYVRRHAGDKPEALALIEHDTGGSVTWKKLEQAVNAFSAKLLSAGLNKGDVLATSLPLLKEHVFLAYACFRTGIIWAPMDLRLKAGELITAFDKIKPKAWFFLGETPVADFRPLVREVLAAHPGIALRVQFDKEADKIMPEATGVADFVRDIKWRFILSLVTGSVRRARRAVGKRDPALIIFTTGSTGSPKPALLCHENVLYQNVALGTAFEMRAHDRMLVNLPPSHVGCTTEQLATTIYAGGTSVLLHVFDPRKSLEAIQQHQVTVLGQIPALFNLEWRLEDYADFDLSTLRFAIYGGQAVPREFLVRLRQMAPRIGTGLGLTETAGFCTYTAIDDGVDDLAKGIGFAAPICPISVRKPMTAGGAAGAECAPGEVGEICLSGPQVFLGYLGDEAATAKTISSDGILYTGDLGTYDDDGLRFSGRRKYVIKPKGYQVFPTDVEDHISAQLDGRVANVGVVGAPHDVFSEGIMAFVEPADASLTAAEVHEACASISAYSRPAHVELVLAGEFPVNRVAKTDYVILTERAHARVAELRAAGGWDAA